MSQRFAAFLLGITLAISACLGGASDPALRPVAAGTDGRGDLTVYAAASLAPALRAARDAYHAQRPAVTVLIATDSSAALEAQIEQGAPADLFLSADLMNPRKLIDRGLASGPLTPFAENRLALIVPARNSAAIRSPRDLASPGIRIVTAASAVPLAIYTQQLLDKLAKEPVYPADFAARFDSNVVSREMNAAAVLAKIEIGEGDAAVVYASDAVAGKGVTIVPLPADANVAARYGGVVVGASGHRASASAFLAWLVGPDGQRIIRSYGFESPS